MRILLWDLETSPMLTWQWSLFDRSPTPLARLVEPGQVICGATKWLGRKAEFRSMWDEGFLQHFWDRLDEADAVVSWNGASFDTKQMNRAFLLAEMPPPSPYKEIDLMKAVKRRFYFPSNKLEHVSDALDAGEKLAGSVGFQDWIDFIDGNEQAIRKMKRYAMQDVRLLEPLYEKLQPWISGHPNVSLISGEDGCPTCGSTSYQKRGFKYTAVSTYQQYRCNDCASWFNDGVRQAGATFRSAT